MSKKEFENKCFSPNWLEVDLTEAKVTTQNKEERQSYRKNLETLLKELDEIKQNIENAREKQRMLANLMGFYTGEYAQ